MGSSQTVRRLVLSVLGVGVAAVAVALGCASSEPVVTFTEAGADAPMPDDEPDADADANRDGGRPTDASDASTSDANRPDANGPGKTGDECSFNRDCQIALRCVCDGPCACQPGARGTGRNGLDACDSGNGCASAVCLEGPADGGFLCTDECATVADCPAKLPRCEDISFVGRICVRQP